jgi:5-methylcytosine-specific restriction endonuclease McrBC regulatory subunit McrC
MLRHQLLQLTDNHFGDPSADGGRGETIQVGTYNFLSPFASKTLAQLEDIGVTVFPSHAHRLNAYDDMAYQDVSVFTLGSRPSDPPRYWINTHNCMGVIRLRDKASGVLFQVEIGSRFDNKQPKQFFLSYLLSKVFGGSIVDSVYLGNDSLWDMLLAFIFRRRLLDASAVGLFKQYRQVQHNDTRIRGRIDMDRHLRQNLPFRGNVAYSTHEITIDNPTNHLIRHALAKVKRKWAGLMTGDGLLNDLLHQLEQNTPTWQSGNVLSCIRRKENQTSIKHPYLGATYEPLRLVSLSILQDEGASLYQQKQEAEGVLFDGSWLWEEYLWTLLRPMGFEHPNNKTKQGSWRPLPGVSLYPDFFHKTKRVVLDAKYKSGDISLEDAKQVFAYMFLLNAIHGGLVKPDSKLEQVEQKISRPLATIAQTARWHSLALSPPEATKTTAIFVEQMRKLEELFQRQIGSLEPGAATNEV